MNLSINEFVYASTIDDESLVQKVSQSTQQFGYYGLFRHKNGENNPNGPIKGSIRRLMDLSFSVNEFVSLSTI